MPRAVEGFQVNDLTIYRPALELADGDASSGVEASQAGSATSGVSGLLDFGPLPPSAVKLHATVKYKNSATFGWRYSQDGVTWTAATTGAGGATDTPLAGHNCLYKPETRATTLTGTGIRARYWQASIQDSDIRTGNSWQCGGLGRPSSEAGLMEIWAEDANGNRLLEGMILPFAQERVGPNDTETTVGDRTTESAAGEGK